MGNSKRFLKHLFGQPRRALCLAIVVVVMALSLAIPPKKAYAQTCGFCPLCTYLVHALILRPHVRGQHRNTREHIRTQFQLHRDVYIVGQFFRHHILLSMQMITEQLTASAMQQMQMVGSFMDAQQQIETMLLFQEKRIEAHKDYHPSQNMCTIGTAAIGLGQTYNNGEYLNLVLSQRSQDRQLHTSGTSASGGDGTEMPSRVRAFIDYFCDPDDAGGTLRTICPNPVPDATINQDVDYTRTVYEPLTLDIDLSDNITSGDEVSVMAMTRNIFSHKLLPMPTGTIFADPANQDDILDVRALLAKRSVAEHSFYSILGLKASGSATLAAGTPYIASVFQQLGLVPDDAQAMLGNSPSYYALMEVLTKKIYQTPAFYTNLYDKPANLQRTGAALRAINLIQDMDRFKSQLRNEAMLSVLVELEIMEKQERLQGRINALQARE